MILYMYASIHRYFYETNSRSLVASEQILDCPGSKTRCRKVIKARSTYAQKYSIVVFLFFAILKIVTLLGNILKKSASAPAV